MAALSMVLWLAVAAGCGGEQGEQYPLDTEPGGNSPEHVVHKFVTGISQGQGDVAASVVDEQSPGAEAARSMLRELARIAGEFQQIQDQAEQKFGEEGAEALGDAGEFAAPLSQEELDAIEIEIDGDEATVHSPDDPEPLQLVRREGRWYLIPPEHLQGDSEEAQMGMQMMQAMFDAIIEQTRTAVEEAETIEELRQSLQGPAGPAPGQAPPGEQPALPPDHPPLPSQ